MTIPESFPAFLATQRDDAVDRGVATLARDDLGDGEVTVRVDWSSINYKDALATIPKGQVARISPLVPGIDLAGEVVASDERRVRRRRPGPRHRLRPRRRPPRRLGALRPRPRRLGRGAARRPLARARPWPSAPPGSPPACRSTRWRPTASPPPTAPCSCSAPAAASAAPRSARSPTPATRCGPRPARPTSTTTCAASARTRSSRARRRPPSRTVRWRRCAGPRPSTRSAAPPRPTPCAPRATAAPSPSAASRRAPG